MLFHYFLHITQLPLIRRAVCMNVFHFVRRLDDYFFEDDDVGTGPGDLIDRACDCHEQILTLRTNAGSKRGKLTPLLFHLIPGPSAQALQI
uniref:Putative secreted protein n=1 Tax=Anopheles darlingi TaxID=43151 RepID=A0A2M4D9K0_ANODA